MKLIWSKNMIATEQEVNQKIQERITQLQADFEGALKGIIERAGSKLKLEVREEVQKQIEDTRQILEFLKSKYV